MENLNVVELKQEELQEIEGGLAPVWPFLRWLAYGGMVSEADRCYCDRSWNNGVER